MPGLFLRMGSMVLNIVGWKMDPFDSSCISAKHGIFLPASHLSLPEVKST